jgi:hypothetical protein
MAPLAPPAPEERCRTLPLQVPPRAYEAKAGLYVVDELDAHRAHDLVIADQAMRELAGREFARVVLII